MDSRSQETFYDRLTNARRVLDIDEEATIDEIKKAFHDLIRRWHPDKACDDGDMRHEKSREVIGAYKTIMNFCKEYKISFVREVVNRYRPEDELWLERFGNDWMWGQGK